MISKLRNNKGITLIELLIVMGLIIVVLLPVSIFFTSNLNHFYRESDRLSAQREAGRIMEVFTVRAMEAKEYHVIGSKHYFTTEQDTEVWIFDHTGSSLEYNTDKTESDEMVELSNHVPVFDIDEIVVNSQVIGVRITLSVTYRRASITLSNEVYFRNF